MKRKREEGDNSPSKRISSKTEETNDDFDLDDLNQGKLEQIADAYNEAVEAGNREWHEAFEHITRHLLTDHLQDLANILLAKVRQNKLGGEEFLNFVREYNEKYGYEEGLIEKSLRDLTVILLDNNQPDLALESYDELRLVNEDAFINDLRLSEILDNAKRHTEALKHCVACNKEWPEEPRKMLQMNDDSTDSEAIKKRNKEYDILRNLDKVSKDEKLVFIAQAVGKSLPYSREVNDRYYEKQKKKLGADKIPDQEFLKGWLYLVLKRTINLARLATTPSKDVENEVIGNLLAEGVNIIRYHRVLSIDNLYDKEHHFYKTDDLKRIHEEDTKKIANCLSPLLGRKFFVGQLDELVNNFNEALIVEYGEDLEVRRPTLSKNHQYNLNNENELDFFANVRLIKRSAHREARNLHRSEFGNRDIERNYHFSFDANKQVPAADITQKRTVKGAIDYVVPNLYSYKKIYDETISPLFRVAKGEDIACFVRGMLRGDEDLIKKDGKKFEHKELEEISTTIAALTTLIFAAEGARNSSTFVVNQMMLDLIIAGKMSWDQALKDELMPMAMEGAVKLGRRGENEVEKELPFSLPHHGPKAAKTKKNLENNLVMEREDAIIKAWLGLHGESANDMEGAIIAIHQGIKDWYPEIDHSQLASYPKKLRVAADKKEEKKSDGKDQKKSKKDDSIDDKKVKGKKEPQAAALQAEDPILKIGNLGMNHVSFLFQNLLQNEVEAGSDVGRSFGRAVIIQNNSSNDDLRTEIENFLVGQDPVIAHGAAAMADLDRRVGQERVLLLLDTQDQIPSALAGISAKEDESAKYNHWTVLHLKKDEQGNLLVKYADSMGSHDGRDQIPASVVKCLKEVCAANKCDVNQEKFISTPQTQLNCGYNTVFHALQMLNKIDTTATTINEFIDQARPMLVANFNASAAAQENKNNAKPSTKVAAITAEKIKKDQERER